MSGDVLRQLPFGVTERPPSASESDFFSRSGVPGYAAPDNRVVMNPSPPPGVNMESVRANEATRVFMRVADLRPSFSLTPEQAIALDKTDYRFAPDADRRATIAARLFSGDPSAGTPAREQSDFVNLLRQLEKMTPG